MKIRRETGEERQQGRSVLTVVQCLSISVTRNRTIIYSISVT